MDQLKRHCLLLAVITAVSIAAVWAPFLLAGQADILYRYWDGPSYVTVAATLYSIDSPVYSAYGFGPAFYAAHLPAFPLAIRLLSPIGYFNAMLLAVAAFSVLAVIAFYFLARDFVKPDDAFLLAAVFILFPARWLIYHSIGATEPLFIFAVLSSLYFFRRGNVAASTALAVLATLTRLNGVLLFPLFIAMLWKNKQLSPRKAALLSLIPLSLAALFSFYAVQFGDFFAFFAVNGTHAQSLFSAITMFGGQQAGELVVLLFAFYLFSTARLWQRGRFDLAALSFLFVVPVLFIAHNDVSRYLLPALPFALLAFDDVLAPLMRKKVFWLAFAVFVVAAYIYAWNVLPQNLMPLDAFERLVGLL